MLAFALRATRCAPLLFFASACSPTSTEAPKASPKEEASQASEQSPSASASSKQSESASEKSSKSPSASEQDPGDEDSETPEPSIKFDLGELPDNPKDSSEDLCKIDFLFVIDNSISMVPEQQNLARSVPGFVKTLTSSIGNVDDYHIGVVSTDENYFNAKPCNVMGGLTIETIKGVDSKNVCGPYENGRNFMTQKDDLETSFACAAKLGMSGNKNEKPAEAALAALSPALAAKDACNEEFLRDDALLVLVIITDEEDSESGSDQGSTGTPEEWYNKIVALKKGRPESVVALSIIGVEPPNQCDDINKAEVGHRLADFTKRFGERGSVYDVCAPNYETYFTQAISIIDQACEDPPG